MHMVRFSESEFNLIKEDTYYVYEHDKNSYNSKTIFELTGKSFLCSVAFNHQISVE